MPASPHILLVDDEVLAIIALEQSLLDEGFRVTTAFDGREALEHWRDGPFDALVTDLRMPVMDGNELIRRTRAQRPTLPVIVMTADSGALRHPESERLRVLHKPFSLHAAVGAVRSMLDRARTPE